MKFISLKTQYKGKIRKFDFHKNTTLIYSKDNSVGKSTLLRMLFYSLGYPIPGTDSILFKNLHLELNIAKSNGNIIIKRHNNQLRLESDNDNGSTEYFLPYEHTKVLAYIFDNKETRVLDNILGAIYLDQDKGWTLLNRGKVIGNIAFSIETLTEGLTNSDIEELKQQLSYRNHQKEKYQGLKAITSYKSTHLNSEIQVPRSEVKILTDELVILGSKKKIAENQLKEVNKSITQNQKSMAMLEKMKLEVQVSGSNETIPVNNETIVNFDSNYNYLEARKWLIKEEIANLNKDIDKNRVQLMNLNGQGELFSTENDLMEADILIRQIEIDEEEINYRIEILKNEIKSLKKQIDEVLSKNPDVIKQMNDRILDYSSRLGVNKYIENKKNFVFINKLKGFSGTVLHKLVISYKLAYIKSIQEYLGIQLPIVLDSPTGREMTQINMENMFELIYDEFHNNQIIIASIYNSPKFRANKIIELTKEEKIFEGTNEIELFENDLL
ncbi:MAG TPA: hypothetical protein DIC28_06470 [Aerococcus urinaeequi]|nr:hypothetical protein [Aerococcus urinaeequi]